MSNLFDNEVLILKDRKEYMREYRERNREKLNEKRRAYYREHKTEILEYSKQWRAENKDKVKAIRLRYYKNQIQRAADDEKTAREAAAADK